MADLLNVYDLSRKKTAVLQNAFNITETQELNKIYTLDFSIPAEDEKIKFIQPFHYVRYGNNGELYRIIKTEFQDGNTSIMKVSCEHVIATLCDDLLFGAVNTSDKTTRSMIVQYGGNSIRTSNVIKWLLDQQSTKNWTLGTCDFSRKFEYLWEQETILNALYSIPREFSKAYQWQFDTTGDQWVVSLKAIDETIHPEYYIRSKMNLLSSGSDQDFADICTRIYPLGYGEGVNQLTIKDAKVINIQKNSANVAINATPSDASDAEKYDNTYIQSPESITNLYGIKEKVLVDRRFEDANSLFSYAKTTLEALQVPSMSRTFNVVDLYPLTNQDIDNAKVGKICKLTVDDTTAYITKTVRVLDDPGNLSIELSTKVTDVASSIADLADRVRIESVYAQGATQIYQHSKDANASKDKGSVLNLYFPSEMRQINKVLLKVQLEKFRSYSKSTSQDGYFTYTKEYNAESTTDGPKDAKATTGGPSKASTTENSSVNLTTSAASGGSGISLDSSNLGVSITISGTAFDDLPDDDRYTKYQKVGTTLKINSDTGNHAHGNAQNTTVVASAGSSGSHSHSYDDTGHTHTISEDDATDSASTGISINNAGSHGHSVSGYVSSSGAHAHGISEANENGHRHAIDRKIFNHKHSFEGSDITGSIKVNNSGKDPTTDKPLSGFSHTHSVTIPQHKHDIPAEALKHEHTIPASALKHEHKFKVPKLEIEIPKHDHTIDPGIYEFGNPTSFSIKVDGNVRNTIKSTSWDGDITSWLLNPQNNQIPRNTWIKVEIIPNDLAYVVSSVFVQGFVQSRGGGNY